jgi:death on curing protein
MAKKWKWIDRNILLLLHDESLAAHGGASGIRDEGLPDSALSRPLKLALYGEPDVAELAASYAFGLAKNHPFVDGNKRAAFLSIGLFLYLNGQTLTASQADATLTIMAVAASERTEADLATWIRNHLATRKSSKPKKK